MKAILHRLAVVVLMAAAPDFLCAQSTDSVAAPTETSEPARSEEAAQPIAVTVRAKRLPPPAIYDRIEKYGEDYVRESDAFTVKELVDSLPSGPLGTQTKVLIDGRETPFNLSTIPVGLVDHVEVNRDGKMPDGSPRVAGQVVNIILKKNYEGGDLNLRQKGSFAGGGGSLDVDATGGYKKEELSVIFKATHNRRNSLFASQREFSREQNHTAGGGRDLRLPWGFPPVVQAVGGTLNGVVDGNGQPVATALMPQGLPPGDLTAADFIAGPSGLASASGLRRFNTADYVYLATPRETHSAGLQAQFPLGEKIRLSAEYTYTRSRADQIAPPPVTPASGRLIVPAAYNPFGQDVSVGLVHAGFGPQRGASSSDNHAAVLSIDGRFTDSWWVNARFSFDRNVGESSVRELDAERFAAALAAADPDERFDPFAAIGAGSYNAGLYPALTLIRQRQGIAQDTRFTVEIPGTLSEGWVGPVTLRLTAEQNVSRGRQNEAAATSGNVFGDTRTRMDVLRTGGHLHVPVFNVPGSGAPASLWLSAQWDDDRQVEAFFSGAELPRTRIATRLLESTLQIPWAMPLNGWRGLHQLETQVMVGQAKTAGESARMHSLGFMWTPFESLRLRASYGKRQIPAPNGLQSQMIEDDQTVVDSQRNVPTTTGVQVMSANAIGLEPSRSRTEILEIEFEPQWLKGLRLQATYGVQNQQNPLRFFSAQDILDNEFAFPGRVIRLPASEEDIESGQPGAVVRVERTPLNIGQTQSRNLDLAIHFRRPTPFGNIGFTGEARYVLQSRNELLPGIPFITTNNHESPPDWTYSGRLIWSRSEWSVNGTFRYLGEGRYAGSPYQSYSEIGLRASYQLKESLWRVFGKGLQIGIGVENLLDTDPQTVDTLIGFRSGSALGRAYQLTLRMPLNSR